MSPRYGNRGTIHTWFSTSLPSKSFNGSYRRCRCYLVKRL
jgi:hypothetical protein